MKLCKLNCITLEIIGKKCYTNKVTICYLPVIWTGKTLVF